MKRKAAWCQDLWEDQKLPERSRWQRCQDGKQQCAQLAFLAGKARCPCVHAQPRAGKGIPPSSSTR